MCWTTPSRDRNWGTDSLVPGTCSGTMRLGPSQLPSVLVVGGSGDYLDVADTVIRMDEYRPRDVTEEARGLAAPDAGAPPTTDNWPPTVV